VLIAHPIRSRIMAALMGRRLTTQQLGELLPDLPLSSIYRHVRLLAEGGLIEAVEEVRVAGAATRVYAVSREGGRLRKEDTRGASTAERLQYLTSFLDTLAAMYRIALDRGQDDPEQHPTHALMTTVHVSPAEYPEFMEGLRRYLEPWKEQPAADGARRRAVFATVMIPDQPDPPREGARLETTAGGDAGTHSKRSNER
jgi:DNA-binding transcriptional ArsR family regulator